ncbi:hypothetical protein [Salinicoccus albus]|uniref:hypothetical protein n=1 Tax=Salinicoccus albus TaxID=418756 RepID=UPI00035D22C7|nr:hypothetical protein [Salinicoccus albus]
MADRQAALEQRMAEDEAFKAFVHILEAYIDEQIADLEFVEGDAIRSKPEDGAMIEVFRHLKNEHFKDAGLVEDLYEVYKRNQERSE